MIKQLKISGFRGYGIEQIVNFSLPNGQLGSGLTFIVGANNSGKTTISEAIKSFNGHNSPSFSEGKRNKNTDGKVNLTLVLDNEQVYSIQTVHSGGSETIKIPPNAIQVAYSLSARRFIEHEFGDGKYTRENFIYNNILSANRGPSEQSLVYRLQQANKENYKDFNDLLKSMLGKEIKWTIEKRDNGNYYIKYTFGSSSHGAEGVGDGILSIFSICDALYDSTENSSIYIDEPELSLHPSLQIRLMETFRKLAKNRQIIINTHSPYFVDWESIFNGASLIRVFKDSIDNNSKIACLDDETIMQMKGFFEAIDNPHIFGLNANEVFFLDDDIILTEGQDDVRILRKISSQVNAAIDGSFYGWGSGGAENMEKIIKLLKKLEYKKIVAIFDQDKSELASILKTRYPEYKIVVLEADDIRDKKAVKSRPAKVGISYSNGILKEDFKTYIESVISNINNYFLE